jgi:hypothetical protein
VLDHFKQILRLGGTAYVSTPNLLTLAPPGAEKSGNPWHLKEYRAAEFRDQCEQSFEHVELLGVFHARPPGPVSSDAVPPHSAGIVVLVLSVCLIAIGFVFLRPLIIRAFHAGNRGLVPDAVVPGAASGLLLVLCVATLAIWFTNPFAAALLIPALHLWLWVVAPDLRMRRGVALALLLGGLVAPALVLVYYARSLGVDPFGLAWSGALLVAGGHLSVLTVIEWSVVAGCALSLVLIAARSFKQTVPEEQPVSIRGPVTYAGPGSLGGTKSALRR